MIAIDEIHHVHCNACHVHENIKAMHQITIGRDISRCGQIIWLCDTCLDELKEKLNQMKTIK